MSDDLPPVDGRVLPNDARRLAAARQRLIEAIEQERRIHSAWGKNRSPKDYDFSAHIRDLLELWRAEVGPLKAPPEMPGATNYHEAAAALDVFQRAVEKLSDSSPSAPPAGSTVTPPGLDSKRFRAGPDYRDCTWNGERYTFTTTQAACVQALWEERDKGTLELSQQLLLEKAGAESGQLKDVFKKHPAWKKMIVCGSRSGLYKLADPT